MRRCSWARLDIGMSGLIEHCCVYIEPARVMQLVLHIVRLQRAEHRFRMAPELRRQRAWTAHIRVACERHGLLRRDVGCSERLGVRATPAVEVDRQCVLGLLEGLVPPS